MVAGVYSRLCTLAARFVLLHKGLRRSFGGICGVRRLHIRTIRPRRVYLRALNTRCEDYYASKVKSGYTACNLHASWKFAGG